MLSAVALWVLLFTAVTPLQPTQLIVAGTLSQLLTVDFGTPLHSLVVAGDTHHIEDEVLAMYAVKPEQQTLVAGSSKSDDGNESSSSDT
eukprot:13454-Heterococcus_DN1.PRE.3